ncbi:serpin family protein [Allonocardiopsis opalescens]|uniref:Serpin B n=1 Tax=Allonocardiopsis opalescens TaxID=1144618 RepID=A0A2T0PU46_9ACTN|nr:serpin family protein [Allonocardiopsis opalescens]PRX92422.1 serpin B [Allonocardiopsis opalescens]
MAHDVHPAQAAFAGRLHTALAPGRAGLVWSPYSVACALGLVGIGAAGATRREIAELVAPGLDLAELAGLLGPAAEPADGDGGASRLDAANTLWLRPDFAVAEGFAAALREWPGASVRPADFQRDPEGARRAVNALVDAVTSGLIPQLVRPGEVSADTQAVLVNALYTRVAWRSPFDPADTRPAPFRTAGGSREVATMWRRERLRHARHAGWELVTLPGLGGLAVDLLLPPEEDAAAVFDPRVLAGLHRAASGTEVELFLPRFAVGWRGSLLEPLAGLGVREVFSDRAELSGITPSAALKVDDVIHEAVLRVDETGAEGAAATAATMVLTAVVVPPEPVVVRFDRPFAVVVRNRGAVLFLAQVADPGDG